MGCAAAIQIQYWTHRGLRIIVSLVISTLYNVFLVRLTLQPLYPFTYLCTSWIANFYLDCAVHFQPSPVFLMLYNEENSIVKPHSHRNAYCYMMYICVTSCFVLEFSCCVSRSSPFLLASNGNLRTCVDWQTADAMWTQMHSSNLW